ncbi:MAG: hypothetical protein PVSMB4_13370 [Ktedonobacterales bacterium]
MHHPFAACEEEASGRQERVKVHTVPFTRCVTRSRTIHDTRRERQRVGTSQAGHSLPTVAHAGERNLLRGIERLAEADHDTAGRLCRPQD